MSNNAKQSELTLTEEEIALIKRRRSPKLEAVAKIDIYEVVDDKFDDLTASIIGEDYCSKEDMEKFIAKMAKVLPSCLKLLAKKGTKFTRAVKGDYYWANKSETVCIFHKSDGVKKFLDISPT